MNITGPGTFLLDGANSPTIQADVNVNDGTQVNLAKTGANVTTLAPAGSVTLNHPNATFELSSDLTLDGGTFVINQGSFNFNPNTDLTIQNGGTFSTARQLLIGGQGTNIVAVTGAGSSLNQSGAFNTLVGSSGGTGILLFSNGSAGNFSGITGVDVGASAAANSNGTLSIENGSMVEITNLRIATADAFVTGAVTAEGTGSKLTVLSFLTMGAANSSSATLDITNGGSFDGNAANINATGVINVDNASATFKGSVTHNGEMNVTNGGTVSFKGAVSGAGRFGGDDGTVSFSGEYGPGNNGPGGVLIDTQVVFLPTNVLTMEIGGLVGSTQHDVLVFNAAAPNTQVAFGGILQIDLINGFNPQAGQRFNLFDFNPFQTTGTFSTIRLAPGDSLQAGLSFDDRELYTEGTWGRFGTSRSGLACDRGDYVDLRFGRSRRSRGVG